MENVISSYGALRPISDLKEASLDQARLIDGILLSSHFEKYPPSESYQLAFWKKVIEYLEALDEVLPQDGTS